MRLRSRRTFSGSHVGRTPASGESDDPAGGGSGPGTTLVAERPATERSATSSPSRGGSFAAGFGRHVWSVVHAGALVIAIVGALALAVVLVAKYTSVLAVRQVQVEGVHEVSEDAVVRAAGIASGTPMAGVDPGAAGRRVGQVPGVEHAVVDRVWPTTVRITVTERVPVLALETTEGIIAVDRHGESFASDVALPEGLVVFAPPESDGEPTVRAVAAVVSSLDRELRALVTSVSAASPREIVLGLTDSRTVVWGDSSDSERKAAVLTALLEVDDVTDFDVSVPDLALVR